MTYEQKKEIAQEAVSLMSESIRQYYDAEKRLREIGIVMCDLCLPEMVDNKGYRGLHVYNGITELANLLEKECKTPQYGDGTPAKREKCVIAHETVFYQICDQYQAEDFDPESFTWS